MTPTDNIHTLSGAYALDALDDLERARFEGHLDTCAACTEEVASFQATTALLGAADELTISPEFRSAVLEEIEHVRQVGPVTTPARVRRRTPQLLAVAAAVLAVAVISLSVVTAGLRRELDEMESYEAIAAIIQADDAITLTEEMGAARLQVVASPGSGAGAILANGMDAAPNGHAYQLWLLTDDDQAIPAGLLKIDDSGHGEHIMRGDMDGVVAVGITVEPEGGSDAPSTDPIAVLQLTA